MLVQKICLYVVQSTDNSPISLFWGKTFVGLTVGLIFSFFVGGEHAANINGPKNRVEASETPKGKVREI